MSRTEIPCAECGELVSKTDKELSEGDVYCPKCSPVDQSESLVDIND